MKTVVGLFDRFEDASQAIQDLRDAGFQSEDISIVARDSNGDYSRILGGDRSANAVDISDGAAAGAGIGALLGGLGGVLVGLGALAIPGIGPVLAAGPLVSALAGAGIGALTGGIVGALVDLGIPEEHAHVYAEGIRQGGTLLLLNADDFSADRAMSIMNRYHPIDIFKRSEDWHSRDWKGYDPDADPLTVEEMEFNRSTSMPKTGSFTSGPSSTTMDRDDTVHHNMDDEQIERLDMEMEDDINMKKQQPMIPMTGRSAESAVLDRDIERDYGRVDAVCMPHYQLHYRTYGNDFNFYQPAYRFGFDLAQDPRYRNEHWAQMEGIAQKEWIERGNQTAWDDIKDAVRHAWNELKD